MRPHAATTIDATRRGMGSEAAMEVLVRHVGQSKDSNLMRLWAVGIGPRLHDLLSLHAKIRVWVKMA